MPTYNDHLLSLSLSLSSKSSSLQTDHGEKIAGGGGSLKVALGNVWSGKHPVVKRVEAVYGQSVFGDNKAGSKTPKKLLNTWPQ